MTVRSWFGFRRSASFAAISLSALAGGAAGAQDPLPTGSAPPTSAAASTPASPADATAGQAAPPPVATELEPASSAAAQTKGASGPSELGVVTVTAQRRTSTIQKTPIAITAFSQDAVQQQRISTFRDLAGRVPGLLAPLRSTAYTTQTYSMRGIGEIDTYPEPSVAVYVDDVYLARSVGTLYDTPDLERVEVLRGPQGTLYGRNSAAGAIRFITKDPKSTPTAGVSVALGNYNNTEVKARLSGGVLPNDLLNASVSIIRHQRRGWTYSVPLKRYVNDLDLWVARTKLKSQITERLSATFSADAMWDRSSQSYYTPLDQPNGVPGSGREFNPNLTWSNTLPLNKTTVYGGSLTLKYELTDNLSVKSVSAWRGMHGPIYYDNDGVTYIKGDSYAGFDQDCRTQELTLNGEFDRVNFVGGLYYFYERFHNHRLSQAAGSPQNNVGTITHTDNEINTISYAAFGQANVKVTDQLSGTLGARYTIDRRRFDNFGQQESKVPLVYPLPGNFDPDLFSTLFTPNATTFDVHQPYKNFTSLTPKVGAQLQANKDALVYLSFSQGFKSGGYDLRANTLNGSVSPYKPQIITAYEAGAKLSLLDNRLTANVAVFYNKIKGIQVRATSPGSLGIPISLLINAGDAHSYGGEAEIAANPFRGLTLGTSVALLRTAYETFTASLPPNVPGRTTLVGLAFPLSPTWQANFNANYRLPLPIPGVIRVGGDVPFESKRYIDIYNTEELAVAPQAFVNATVSYTSQDERWSAGVAVNNLLDLRRAQAGGYAPTNAGTEPLNYRAYNPPRFINFFVNIGTI